MKDDHREQARSARRAMTKPVAGRPVADFDKKRHTYLDWLRFRYRDHLHMDVLAHGSAPSSLSARGTASLWLPVRETFVPQWVRTRSHETELPREVRQALAAQGRLSEQDIPKDVVREQLNHELRAYADTPVRSVLDVICEPGNRQILMLGAPGAGKSTLAIYVTVSLADLADSNGPKADGHPLASLTGYLPLFLDLRTYQAGAGSTPEAQGGSEEATPLAVKAIFRGISHQGLSSRVLEPYLAGGGKALVIFDGLDEVFDKNQRDLIKWGIAYFADRYKGVRVLVTCRSVGYESEVSWFVAHGFESLVIQDLDREQQIPEFVRRFYHVAYPNHPDQAMALAKRLNSAVRDSPAIEELAGNPMLLTALALLGRGVPLPHQRGAVLKHLIDLLVKLWDADKLVGDDPPSRGIRDIDPFDGADAKRALLGLVARRMQEGGPGSGGLKGNYLSGQEIRDVFIQYRLPASEELPASLVQERRARQEPAPEEVQRAKNFATAMLDQLRRRDYILAEFGQDTFGFAHRALLDYLTADDINGQFYSREIGQLGIEEMFRGRSESPEWQEVLLLLTGMLPPDTTQKAIVALLRSNPLWYLSSDPLPRHVLLAIRCLGEVLHLHKMPAVSQAAVNALIALFETVSGPADYPLALDLAQAMERDVLPVISWLGPDWTGRPAYVTWYLARGQYLGGDAPGLAAIAAARIYVALLGRDDGARDRLYVLATSADSVLVRGAALEALARNWLDEPQVAELLRAAAVDSELHWYPRREAVRALAARRRGDPATADLLHVCAKRGQAPEIREAALRWLAAGWRKAEATPALLRAVGSDCADLGGVRAVAVAELASGWPDEQTREWLEGRADDSDDDGRVRAAAAEALAAGWRDERTRQWLHQHTRSNEERQPQVRSAALRGLAAGWHDQPDTETLLQAKASVGGDDDPAVRQAAVEALTAGRRDDPETGQWLRDQLAIEPNDNVRCMIVQALASYWRDAATVTLLKALAEDRDRCVRAIAIRAVADIHAGEQAEKWLPSWLREQATKDKNKNPYVRQVALSAAAAGRPRDRKMKIWLMERAADTSEDVDVRGAAIQALAANWPSEETFELLRDIGEGGARTVALRQVAVRLVATGWRNDPRTYAWLSHLAVAAHDGQAVRRTALQLLAADTEWRDAPSTLALLGKAAVDDKSPQMQHARNREAR